MSNDSAFLDQRIPVVVITGFLGAGKTTLVNRVLSETHGRRVAVVVNEFGDIGIDGDLVVGTDEEVYELTNGCICCNVRGDLVRALGRLARRQNRFDLVLVETTGLAAVAPIAQTFLADDEINSQFLLKGVVTVVDATQIASLLSDEHDDVALIASEQIVFADRVLVSKVDRAGESAFCAATAAIAALNPIAEIARSTRGDIDLSFVLDVHRELVEDSVGHHAHDHEELLSGITSISMRVAEPLDYMAVNHWLSQVITEQGPDIYRAKGVLNIEGDPHRFIFHSVHQLFDGWPDRPWEQGEDRTSRLIFIGRGLDEAMLISGLSRCLAKLSISS